jgi:hypothetical protein
MPGGVARAPAAFSGGSQNERAPVVYCFAEVSPLDFKSPLVWQAGVPRSLGPLLLIAGTRPSVGECYGHGHRRFWSASLRSRRNDQEPGDGSNPQRHDDPAPTPTYWRS